MDVDEDESVLEKNWEIELNGMGVQEKGFKKL